MIIAKLDRLSRNAAFVFTLKDSGVDFVCADMPDANTLTIGIFAVLAQLERWADLLPHQGCPAGEDSAGARLGKPENLTDQAREAASQSLRDKAAANENNRRAAALVQAYRKQGLTWLAIAGKLKRGRFQSQQGRGVSGGPGTENL